MSSKFIPNSFQVPNAFVDLIMRDLKDVELRCYLLLIRKTVGWCKEADFVSVSQFAAYTGKGKTAIIAAMKSLKNLGLVVELNETKNRTKGYALNVEKFDGWGSESEPNMVQKVNHIGSESEPNMVQKVNHIGSESEPNMVQKVNTQNTNTKPNNKNNITRPDGAETVFSADHVSKTSPTEKSGKVDLKNLLAEFGIVGQLADDYIAHRKAKRASISPTVLNNLVAEAAKAHMTVQQAIEYQIAQGWQGFQAEWVLNKMGLNSGKTADKSSVNDVPKHKNGGFQSWS